ncbi:MAG: hypothetical protein U0903_02450 [Planctomycetales bacterium]
MNDSRVGGRFQSIASATRPIIEGTTFRPFFAALMDSRLRLT